MNKISPNRIKKEQIVAKLSEKAAKAKGLVFTNYQGLTHKQLENLRKKVQAMDADFVATKNTLLKLSLSGNQTFSSQLSTFNFKNATATLFLYGDPVGPLKEIAKAIKEFNLPTIKFGILDGQALTSDQLLKISALPSRETLLTQLVFGLKSPITGLHRSLLWNIQKFVLTLNAVKNTKTS